MGKFETKQQILGLFAGAAGVAALLILLLTLEVIFYFNVALILFILL